MKGSFSKFVLIVIVTLSITGLNCSDPIRSTDYSATASFSFEENIQNQSRVVLEGITGSVHITGVDGATSVKITGERTVESESTQDANEHLQELEVRVQNFTNEISITTIQPNDSGGRNYTVDYIVTIPRTLAVVVSLVTGGVTVNSINNSVSISNVTGTVTLDDISGNTSVSLVTGLIDCEATLPLNGLIVLSTVTGTVRLDIPQTTSAQFSSSIVTGSINVSGIELLSIESTPRTLRGTFGSGQGTISLSTVTGDVIVRGF